LEGRVPELQGRRVLVVGFARSGLASTNLLLRKDAKVTVTDLRRQEALQGQIEGLAGPVQMVFGRHQQQDFMEADLIVTSPGVPSRQGLLQQAAEAGIPIWSEVELAYRFLKGSFIGVTGTNGKTTTTALTGALFERAGVSHAVAGNIGTPLTGLVDQGSDDRVFIVELSSFQLETIQSFRCSIALVLNLTPDHLDRHQSFEQYVQAKRRILLNQTAEDFAVLNADDPNSKAMGEHCAARVFLFSERQSLHEGVSVEEGQIWIRWEGSEYLVMPVEEIRMPGRHNLQNVLAAVASGFLKGLDPILMAQVFRDFAGVEHRLEQIGSRAGVRFYNDSKATNVEAAARALEALEGPLIVIMGGRDKGADFGQVKHLMKDKVKLLVLLGEARSKIRGALQDRVETLDARDMAEAVALASDGAQPGDTVLLAPACASFDMFDDFEHRGRAFKEAVAQMGLEERA